MSFKTFDLAHDVTSLASAVNEVVTVSNTIYSEAAGSNNVKKFSNISGKTGGYWQTAYDSATSSLQSTPLFDMTFGFHPSSSYAMSGSASYYDEKVKIYRQMASMLLGDPDLQFAPSAGATPWNDCFFLMVKRGIMKDEIKKGSVQLFLTGSGAVTASDVGAATAFKQTVGGDYSNLVNINLTGSVLGQVFYNAGVIVLSINNTDPNAIDYTNYLNWNYADVTTLPVAFYWKDGLTTGLVSGTDPRTIQSGTIDDVVDGLRNHVKQIGFHNQTNLYSTVYFCRATNTEFNYSSNPTYLDESSRIRVTSGSNVLQSRTYITTVGLYDASDNLLAVGKVNKPITKSPDTESIFRIRLDY